MTCPHCNKTDRNPYESTAYRSAEAYGSSEFVFRCPGCKKKYQAYFEVIVRMGPTEIAADDADLSFG